ncbi:MAG: winged helix-turn-helix transcriptional regulator [Proteobacteria bacterium]|nr:winged helix-turn-helix transcriptional regulator [Pseudomonadota bacterium]
MIKAVAILAFGALAHEHRLQVFRMLIRKGPGGISAGDIAHRLGVPPSSLSFHLGQLERAGLIKSWRDQRRIIYAADIDGTRRVLTFLTEDCCDGHPEICGGLIAGNEARKGTPQRN